MKSTVDVIDLITNMQKN